MFQLKWDENYLQTVRDIPYWHHQADLPSLVIDFIEETSDNVLIYNDLEDIFYCGKCLTPLNQKNFCPKCHKQYKSYQGTYLYDNRDVFCIDNSHFLANLSHFNHSCHYLVFNVDNENTYLYYLTEEIYYEEIQLSTYQKHSHIFINNSYLIEKDGLTDLEANLYVPFIELAKYQKNNLNQNSLFNETFITTNLYDQLLYEEKPAYLYLENLNKLKNTIYQYSRIWQTISTLNTYQTYTIAQLTFYPLYYPQFEYLVNYKLYNLALKTPYVFTKGSNFKDIFGLDKKYLTFMVENNLSFSEYFILKLYPLATLETIKYFSSWLNVYSTEIIELVNNYHIDLNALRTYLCNADNYYYLSEYLDYLNLAQTVHLDLNDKQVLYPKDLFVVHNNLYDQIQVIYDPVIDAKIHSLADILAINNYEDDTYVIYPASSIASLVDESHQQKNCVRTYISKIANFECQVYFMRQKKNLNKSYVTIEIKNNTLVQARLKYNKLPNKKVQTILNKWVNTLIPLTISNH